MNFPFLQIAWDPTIWVLTSPLDAQALTGSGDPVLIPVSGPQAGAMLLLSSRAAATAVLTDIGGATPNGGGIMAPAFIYLPTAAGLTPGSPKCLLPAGANLAAVQAKIAAAMSQGTSCTVECRDGAVVLNGATLPFVVLCPAPAGG
jgi:hypothetical protein